MFGDGGGDWSQIIRQQKNEGILQYISSTTLSLLMYFPLVALTAKFGNGQSFCFYVIWQGLTAKSGLLVRGAVTQSQHIYFSHTKHRTKTSSLAFPLSLHKDGDPCASSDRKTKTQVPDAEGVLGHEIGEGLHYGRRLGLLVVGEDSCDSKV